MTFAHDIIQLIAVFIPQYEYRMIITANVAVGGALLQDAIPSMHDSPLNTQNRNSAKTGARYVIIVKSFY